MIGENVLLLTMGCEEISLVVMLMFQWSFACRHLIHDENLLVGECAAVNIGTHHWPSRGVCGSVDTVSKAPLFRAMTRHVTMFNVATVLNRSCTAAIFSDLQ